jgi:hypothetical protein
MSGCDGESNKVKKRVARVHELVDVGMKIDVAIDVLRDEGFDVGDKYQPAKGANYYIVVVGVRESTPPDETLRYTLGVEPSDRKYSVILKADQDGTITSVE